MYQIKCTYEGLAPMLQDRFFNPEEAEIGQAKLKGGKDKKKEVVLKLHRDKKGVFVPADVFRMMLIGNKARPGAAKILGSYVETKKATEYVNVCESFIWTKGIENPLKVYIKPIRKTMDEVDERSFPTKGGGRLTAMRPVISMPWTVTFIIEVTDDHLVESKVREFYEVAGFRCGIGAHGPTFGRCRIIEWEVLSEPEKKSKRKKK